MHASRGRGVASLNEGICPHRVSLEGIFGLLSELDDLFLPTPHPLGIGASGFSLELRRFSKMVKRTDFGFLPEAMRHAVPERKIAFLAGRLCAEHALAALGMASAVVPRQADGSPHWPGGIAGSISHTSEHAYAAVQKQTGRFGIGIDSEKVVSTEAVEDIEKFCCTDEERFVLRNSKVKNLPATLVFSAKEALYKAVHPVVKRFVDFDEFQVNQIDWGTGKFSIRPVSGGLLAKVVPSTVGWFRLRRGVIHTYVSF